VLFATGYSFVQSDNVEINIELADDVDDYNPVVRKIIEKYPKENITLHFGVNIYKFYPEKTRNMYVCISNNDNGNKRIAFDFENEQKRK
jgi:hypothetical protein